MKKVGKKVLAVIKYIFGVLTWSLFVILICAALFLFYYFISLKIYESKGSAYRPPISIYTIVSPSMVPVINVYDIVINTKVDSPDDIEIGDIITFISTSSISKGLTITHRVVNKFQSDGTYKFETMGDNNVSKDTMPADWENVIGKAVMKLPQVGRVQFFLASGLGWTLVVVLPSLFVIIKDVIKLVKITNMRKQARLANINLQFEEDKRVAALLEEKESPIIIK
jgi:signal peptidase I